MKNTDSLSPATAATATESATRPRQLYWRDPTVWLLTLGALLLRILYNLALYPDGHPSVSFVIDEREYFGAAYMFAEGRGFSFYDTFVWVRPSLYTALLGGILRASGMAYLYLPVLLVQPLLSALTLLPVGRLADLVAGRLAARWTLFLEAAYLPLTLFAGLLLSETLFVFLFACALLCLWNARLALFAGEGGIRSGGGGRRWWWVVGAGLLLGAAALTRATALAFVPVAAVWLALSLPRSVGLRTRITAACLLLVVSVAAILPITVRNYAAYNGFILLDTTAGYNLWLGSQGVRDEERLRADLLAVPNQADRQQYALSKAWENISRDPAAFATKGLKESLDLWRPLLSAEENAAQGYPSGRVPAWHLISLLLFDTGLYIGVLVLAVAGLAFTTPNALKWLTGGWALLWVVMSFVFFAVTRFRLPIVVSLLPWAGVGLGLLQGRAWRLSLARLSTGVRVASAAALLAIAIVVAASAPLGDTLTGVQMWAAQGPYRRAEQLVGQGKIDEAISSYRQANMDVADTRYGLAAALLRKGDTGAALATLRSAEPEDRYEPAIIRGQAARMSGDLKLAGSFFNARVVQVKAVEALDWAWGHLAPVPSKCVEVGSGLDVGYVRGFYGPEKDAGGRGYRWSTNDAQVCCVDLSAGKIVLSGWRPEGLPAASVSISNGAGGSGQEGATVFQLPVTTGWESRKLGAQNGATADRLRIGTGAFVFSGSDPRLLGVRVSTVGACEG